MSTLNPSVPTSLQLHQKVTRGSKGDSWLAQDEKGFPSLLLKECRQSISDLHKAMQHIDKTGLSLTECLNRALENTTYKCVGEALRSKLTEVYSFAASASSTTIFSEMDEMLSSLCSQDTWRQDPQIYGQMLCHVSLLLTKLKRQYFAVCFNKMADLIHSLLCLKGEEPAAGEVTKLVLKLGLADGLDSPAKSNSSLPSTPWGSPKIRKARQDVGKTQNRHGGFRILSLFERKTSPEEKQSSFYVDIADEAQPSSNASLANQTGSLVNLASTGEDGGYKQQQKQQQQFSSGEANEDLASLDQGGFLRSFNSGGVIGENLMTFDPLTQSRSPSSFALTVSPPSKLASEEELESVINLLSGLGCNSASPMQAIPEVPSQGPMQLAVPQIYRMASPAASDTQIEDHFKPLSRQPHRRSEGCLDLTSMWPSPHQLSPSPNLPWVQVFSASSHGSISECPSPISGYGRDSVSPGFTPSPSPSYPPSPARMPPSSNTLTVGGNVRGGRALSPSQPPPSLHQQHHHHQQLLHQQQPTWGSSYSLGGVIGGLCPRSHSSTDFAAKQQATWPLHGASSFSSAPGGWSGLQDGSDLSDDSSAEDQFFAVGKDLCHALDSKNGTTDEETEAIVSSHAKNSSTWPLQNHHRSSEINRGLTPDLLEPPEAYQQHKPIQMQWSDPISTRSMWSSGSLDMSQRKTSQSMHGFGGVQ